MRLSDFRRLERLPGTVHPAVYRVSFACSCGDDHIGLVAHNDLDWAPLGLTEGEFVNLMTNRVEPLAAEFGDLAIRRIEAGNGRGASSAIQRSDPARCSRRSFWLLGPGVGRGTVSVAVRCPACGRASVNLVSAEHVDVPFHNDPEIGVVEHVFAADVEQAVEEFRTELYSGSFDARRLRLH